MMSKDLKPLEKQALKDLETLGKVFRSHEALQLGIHPRTLYSLRDKGVLTRISRGCYTLTSFLNQYDPDILVVSKKIPKGVLCLISALYYQKLTTQIPHMLFIAIPRGYHPPSLTLAPVQYISYSKHIFEEGIETIELNGVKMRCYSRERTIADCFKHRNKIGIDVALEALKTYWRKPGANISKLLKFAKLLRIENVMTPYIEAVIDDS